MNNTPEYPYASQPYPMQPPVPPPTPKKSHKMLWFIIGGIALVMVLCCGVPVAMMSSSGSLSSNNGTKIGNSSQQSKNDEKKQDHFNVGDQVKVGDRFIVTVNSFSVVKSKDQYEQPKEGNQYVLVDVTVKNPSGQEQEVYGSASFTFRDDTGQEYDNTYIDDYKEPSGKIEQNNQIKGQFVYEVPKSKTKFTLAFEADWLSSGQTIWDLALS